MPCVCETPLGSSVLRGFSFCPCLGPESPEGWSWGLWSWVQHWAVLKLRECVLGSTTKSDWVQTRQFRTIFKTNQISCRIQPPICVSRSWRTPQTKQRDASDERSASELNTFTGFRSTPKTRWPVYNTCYQKSYYLFVLPYRKFVVKGLFSLPVMTGLQLPALYSLDIERNETTFTLHVLS